MIDINQLDAFLRELGPVTYASGQNKAPPSRPNSEDYHYEQGDWIYHDCYWGSSHFIGHEVVWHKGRPVWGMNYYGGPTNPLVDTNAAYGILKLALLAVDETIIPVRGPARFEKDGLLYKNHVTGDLTNFEALETIERGDLVLCRHKCHGGLIV